MEERRLHAVQEVHAHGHLMDHLELLWPHKSMSCEKMIKGSSVDELHHCGS